MRSLSVSVWVALLVFLVGGDSQLTIESERILSGSKLCPDEVVRITCVAYNVRVVMWLRNGSLIEQFTNQDMPSTEPEVNGELRIYLNSSVNDGQNNLNVTSTLVGPASAFQSGDRIACPNDTGDPLALNFTTTTPVPNGFQVSVSQGNTDDTLYLDIRWDSAFNAMYGIESYLIEASGGFISCPQTCASNDSSPCQCSGLTARMDGNITIIATTCGDQLGAPAVIYLTPRVPDQISSCSSYPVYNASNRLYRIETTWNQVVNPHELTSAVGQNILDYSVSFNGEATPINCSNTNLNCSLYVQPITDLVTVSVAARNIIGQGQESSCNLSSSANSQTNDVFTIILSTTNLNRSVDCRSQMQGLSCQFCIEVNDVFTCYDLENTASNSAANAALTNLEEGTYRYRVTASLNGIPVASIYDSFSTACQPGDLGAIENQMNSSCLSIGNGRVCYNGTTAGSVATYSCEEGFMLTGSGNSQRMCRSDGLWEGDIPTCDATDDVPGWVIPLLAISVVLWVISLVEGVVSILLVVVLGRKFSRNDNKYMTALSYILLAVEIVLFVLVFILWMVYASDPKGSLGRDCAAAAFAFSLVLVILGFIDWIPVLPYLRSAVFNVSQNTTERDDLGEEDPEKHQRHKKLGQN